MSITITVVSGRPHLVLFAYTLCRPTAAWMSSSLAEVELSRCQQPFPPKIKRLPIQLINNATLLIEYARVNKHRGSLSPPYYVIKSVCLHRSVRFVCVFVCLCVVACVGKQGPNRQQDVRRIFKVRIMFRVENCVGIDQ